MEEDVMIVMTFRLRYKSRCYPHISGYSALP
jgi:hypothetical protein